MVTALAGGPSEQRAIPRDEVDYCAPAFGPDAEALSLSIVNLSARGLMAQGETPYAVGERMRVLLPGAGVVVAEIRWVAGGRIGCELEQAIDLADDYDLLAVMLKPR